MDRPEEDTEELIDRDALMRWADEAPVPRQSEEDDDFPYVSNAHKKRAIRRRMRMRIRARRR